jgi:hypothetical protein
VNNSVHIQVKAIELGDAILGNELRDGRIPLRKPSEELGNTGKNGISLMIDRTPFRRHRNKDLPHVVCLLDLESLRDVVDGSAVELNLFGR